MKKIALIAMIGLLFADVIFPFRLGLGLGLSAKNILLALFLLVILVQVARQGIADKNVEIPLVHVLFVGLIIYGLCSIIFVSLILARPGYGLIPNIVHLKSYFADNYLFFIVFLASLTNSREARLTSYGILGLVLVSSILVFVDYFNIPDLDLFGVFRGRIEGAMGQANESGAFLAFFIPVCVGAALVATGVLRVSLFVLAGLNLYLLILTGSRGALLGLLLGTAIGGYLMRDVLGRKRLLQIILIAFLTVLASVSTAYFMGEDAVVSRLERIEAGSLDEASSGRTFFWSVALGDMLRSPVTFLTGFGWNAFAHIGVLGKQDPHNLYVFFLYNTGLIGCVLYLGLIAVIIKLCADAAKISGRSDSVLLVAFVMSTTAFAISNFFSSPYDSWMFVWAYSGLMCRLAINARVQEVEELTRNSTGETVMLATLAHKG